MFATLIRSLRLLNWLNWIMAVVLLLFLGALAFDIGGLQGAVFTGFPAGSPGASAIRLYLFGLLVAMMPVALAVHLILTRLGALVSATAAGDAFTHANAARLQAIGWALLAINVADLVFGWLSVNASAATGEYFGWSFSLTGWIAVPMLFVLAHVFRQGATMREDLEGTV